jgi:hypothetical protein
LIAKLGDALSGGGLLDTACPFEGWLPALSLFRCSLGRDRAGSMESRGAMPEQKAPRFSDLKRALRWLRAQDQDALRKPPVAKTGCSDPEATSADVRGRIQSRFLHCGTASTSRIAIPTSKKNKKIAIAIMQISNHVVSLFSI